MVPKVPEPSSSPESQDVLQLPPKDLAALQRLRIAIERQQLDLSLGRRSLRVLAAMLDHPRQVALSSITELAQAFEVSAATLSRLARELGFDNYKAFARLFKQESGGHSHYYSQQARRLSSSERQTVQHLVRLETMLKQIQTMNEEVLLAQVAGLLHKGRRVKVYARRQSTSLATFLGYCLAMLRPRVTVLGAGELGASHSASLLEAGDVAVFIGFHPYSPSTVKVARVAQEKGCRVVAITDSHQSPLAALAEWVLRVPVDSGFYSNSLVAASALIEILLDKAAVMAGSAGIAALEEREQLIVKMQDEY